MSEPASASAATFRPVEPLTPANPRIWRKLGPNKYALGNRAVVEEISGNRLDKHQVWQWQVIKFGTVKPLKVHGPEGRDKAMRAAEFQLGIGEMEVEK